MNILNNFMKKMGFISLQEFENKIKTIININKPHNNDLYNYISWYDFIENKLQISNKDKEKYKEYDKMDDEMSIISEALDVTTDYIIYGSDTSKNQLFEIKHENKNIQNKIDNFLKRTKFYYHFPSMLRSALKYGDNYEELLKDKTGKVVDFINIPLETVIVNIQNGIINDNEYIYQVNEAGEKVSTFKRNEVFTLTILKNRKKYFRTGKGESIIEKCRFIYRQLKLMEEGIIISRLSRANQYYGMLLDVGELQGDDAIEYVEKFKKRLQRQKKVYNNSKMSYEYNPMSTMSDIVLPTRAGSNSNIIPLNKSSDIGKNIEDVKHFENHLIYSTGVPKILLGKEEDVNSKSTSETQLTCFFRKIRKYQNIITPMIKELIIKSLKYENINIQEDDLTIEWSIVDAADEERKWKIEKIKLEVASMLAVDLGIVDDLYIYTEIMGLTEEEAKVIMNRLDTEEENYKNEVDEIMNEAIDYSLIDDDKEFYDMDKIEKEQQKEFKKQVMKFKNFNEFIEHIKTKIDEKEIDNLIKENKNLEKVLINVFEYVNDMVGK